MIFPLKIIFVVQKLIGCLFSVCFEPSQILSFVSLPWSENMGVVILILFTSCQMHVKLMNSLVTTVGIIICFRRQKTPQSPLQSVMNLEKYLWQTSNLLENSKIPQKSCPTAGLRIQMDIFHGVYLNEFIYYVGTKVAYQSPDCLFGYLL